MLGSSAPTVAADFANRTPTSATRGSRLRGLSLIRSYTQHISSLTPRADPPPLTRSTSTPLGASLRGPLEASVRETARTSGSPAPPTVSHQTSIPTGDTNGGNNQCAASGSPMVTVTTVPAERPAANMSGDRTASVSSPDSDARAGTAAQISAAGEATAVIPDAATSTQEQALPSIRFIPHIEHYSTRPSLHFSAVTRTLKTADGVVRVGRFSERDNQASDPPVGFKSKVVSRRHCEFWCTDGQWYIKDVKSSSGTFLNHVRLSSPGVESRPYPVHDGDVVQLGIDFKGGEEVIFRCVKIRIECNRAWQKSLNSYNVSAHKRLIKGASKAGKRDSDAGSVSSSECSICLNPVAPCQALFVAPCSHVWHFKCIRNLIHGPDYPGFLCPNCRFVADLEADVEQPELFEEYDDDLLDQLANGDQNGDERSAGEPIAAHGTTNSKTLSSNAEDILANELQQASLQDDAASSSNATAAGAMPSISQALEGAHEGGTQPIPVAARKTNSHPNDNISGRSPTPTSTTTFTLALLSGMDGPMTPRNDAGPFVLDGSAGRPNDDSESAPQLGSDSEALLHAH